MGLYLEFFFPLLIKRYAALLCVQEEKILRRYLKDLICKCKTSLLCICWTSQVEYQSMSYMKKEKEVMKNQSAVSSLMYAIVCTRQILPMQLELLAGS